MKQYTIMLFVGGVVASWLVCVSFYQLVWVHALAEDILTVSTSALVYECILAEVVQGGETLPLMD